MSAYSLPFVFAGALLGLSAIFNPSAAEARDFKATTAKAPNFGDAVVVARPTRSTTYTISFSAGGQDVTGLVLYHAGSGNEKKDFKRSITITTLDGDSEVHVHFSGPSAGIPVVVQVSP